MITETRKSIIEIIEPYMDKTLSEGCLVKRNQIGKIDVKNDFGDYVVRFYHSFGSIVEVVSDAEFNILGHYDITSVLKYIYSTDNWIHLPDIYDSNKIDEISFNIENNDADILSKLQLKPLHLYTEQEDKDLLELLQKLGG